MKSITIHNLNESLDVLIREIAKKRGLSLNKTIQLLLQQALGLQATPSHYHKDEFIDLCGIWSEQDISEFNKKTQIFNEINDLDWK